MTISKKDNNVKKEQWKLIEPYRGAHIRVKFKDIYHHGIYIDDENVEILDDISKLDTYINSDEECFVIGGATIYKLLMPYSNKMYITKINQSFEGDVWFPEIKEEMWKEISREKGLKNEENPFDYEYITYVKK